MDPIPPACPAHEGSVGPKAFSSVEGGTKLTQDSTTPRKLFGRCIGPSPASQESDPPLPPSIVPQRTGPPPRLSGPSPSAGGSVSNGPSPPPGEPTTTVGYMGPVDHLVPRFGDASVVAVLDGAGHTSRCHEYKHSGFPVHTILYNTELRPAPLTFLGVGLVTNPEAPLSEQAVPSSR